ncbi:hypothetical protein ANI_1_2002014 [Paecilomyces variotii No. 5]|uniref:Copper acquisition factor BIM1-like domain-containing protein n=1 Tax=Byssochlamys spectabilis (strain No. 5 / NBRC 109023) TaxID=1356009 RepID=V5FJ80_BYSSN|nr:hypothetical protein ANI_1_2002014 [Paecilomyces variotii No. 5]
MLMGAIALYVNAQESNDMGPAAFLWPPDRAWVATEDNIPPCGSSAGVGNRTNFPLTNAAVALVLQDESYSINLAVSYDNDPQSIDDFTTIVSSKDFPELYPGHECYAVPNPPSNITPGTNATLQIKYSSDFDTPQNQTFYACSDITYVPSSEFKVDIPCFNVSTEDPEVVSSQIAGPSTSATSTAGTTKATGGTAKSDNNSLSGGDIAGIVVGSVVGGCLILGILFFLWRLYRQRARREENIAIRMKELSSPVQPTTPETSNT